MRGTQPHGQDAPLQDGGRPLKIPGVRRGCLPGGRGKKNFRSGIRGGFHRCLFQKRFHVMGRSGGKTSRLKGGGEKVRVCACREGLGVRIRGCLSRSPIKDTFFSNGQLAEKVRRSRGREVKEWSTCKAVKAINFKRRGSIDSPQGELLKRAPHPLGAMEKKEMIWGAILLRHSQWNPCSSKRRVDEGKRRDCVIEGEPEEENTKKISGKFTTQSSKGTGTED